MIKKRKRTPETMIAICDTIAGGTLSYQRAAMMNGVSPRSFWLWIKLSQQDPEAEGLVIDYLGERVPFARAVNAARRIALHEMRGRMEQKSVLGWDEPIFFSGMPTWKPDPATVGWSEDDREAFGYPRDGLLRDENGHTIQNTQHHEPPVALQLRVAEMAFPREYRPGVNQSVDVNHNISGIHHAKPPSYDDGPPPVPPPPKLPSLEVLNGPDAMQIPETGPDAAQDDDLDELLGPEPEPASPPPPPVERVIMDTPAPRETPTPQPAGSVLGPMTDLKRDLLAKLEEARARGAKL